MRHNHIGEQMNALAEVWKDSVEGFGVSSGDKLKEQWVWNWES